MPRDPRLSRLWRDPRIVAWALGMVVASPVLALLKLRRYLTRRRVWEIDPARWRVEPLTPELTAALLSRSGPHVVFVGGGFGEMMMVDRVAAALRKARPDARITYCLRDPTTVAFLREQRKDQNLALWPFDALPPVARWLAQQRPDVVVFTERFRFVAMLTGVARYGARVALMNGRCRTREGAVYRLMAPFYRWQFGAFSAMAMQREDYFRAAPRFARPDCDIRLTGDIKTDLEMPSLDPERLAGLERWLPDDLPLLAAGSTETLEEERMVLEAFRQVRAQVPCRLLLAPRRPWALDDLLTMLQEEGESVSRRTREASPTDVLLLDTLGELTTAYRRCASAYVGGAYSEGGGGHNVMEPLMWGVPVAYGMRRGHFEALQRLVEEKGVGTRIKGADDLAAFWLGFLRDEGERTRVGEIGRRTIEENRGAVERTVATLIPLLDAS